MERAGGAEYCLLITGSSGVDQLGLHVHAKQGIEYGGRDIVGARDHNRLAGDVLVIEIHSSSHQGVKRERRLMGGFCLVPCRELAGNHR